MELEEMIKKHENLIWLVIHRNKFYFDDKEDLYSIGMLGLIKGIKQYDESKGTESNYLYHCIYNEIGTVGRKGKRKAEYKHTSLDYPLRCTKTGDSLGTVHDLIGTSDTYYDLEVFDYLDEVVKTLTDTERYCFIECMLKERNQRDVANEVGLSQSYVSRVLIKARTKIRKAVDIDV